MVCVYLGYVYYWGEGVEKDYQKAMMYYEIAAGQTDFPYPAEEAKFFLGEMYYWGNGMEKDY